MTVSIQTMRLILLFGLVATALSLPGAELFIDFQGYPLNQSPTGFVSKVSGEGDPGTWKVIEDEVPTALRSFTGKAGSVNRRPVLAQTSENPIDEHFPLLIYDRETFDDFTFSARVKTVKGRTEQMAGLAFRIQDEKNYYILRLSSLGGTFRFYKFVNGIRSAPIGPEVPIASNVWHEVAVECKGNQIKCFLNGREAMPVLTDNSFPSGKIGFWTKSDSVSYFTDARVSFKPREPFAQVMVRETLQTYPRILGLKVYAARTNDAPVKVIASNRMTEIGSAADKAAEKCAREGGMFYAKGKESVHVTMPLHDRNGDPVASVRLMMKTFKGQTEDNALVRARPIIQEMEARIRSREDLLQ